ncbi:MAG: ABC transporter substrate-binding protein [Alphaproteobacteria bacterium]
MIGTGDFSISRRRVLAGSAAAALAGWFAMPGRARAADDFKIGAVASLSGPASAFGKDWAEGFQVYAKSWNERGGTKGRKIAFELLDDESTPANAVNAFRRLASKSDTSVIWIALASQTALGIKAVSDEFKVPVISGGGVDSLGRPPSSWFFKIAPGGSDYVAAVLQFAKAKNYKRIASLHATDAIGQADKQWITEFAGKAGIEVVAQETFALTDTNFSSQLIKIRAAKPDLIYNGATANPAIFVFKQVKQLEIKTPMILSQAAINRAFFQAIGGPAEAEGYYSVISVGALAAEMGGETARIFEQLSKALGRPAILFHTFGWDTGILTEWAANNSDGSRQGLRDAMERAKEIPAINGPFNYSADNHIGQDTRGLVMAQLKGGKFVKVD